MTEAVRPARPTMRMHKPVGERRSGPRLQPTAELSAVVRWNGQDHSARLLDVTPRGVGLGIDDFAGGELPEVGAILHMCFRGPREAVARKGKVAWAKQAGKGFRLGVEFVELPADTDCIGLLNVERIKIDPSWAMRLPPSLALRRQVLPFACVDGHVHVACANPKDAQALQAVERAVGLPLKVELAEPASLGRVLDRVYGDMQAATAAGAGQLRSRSVDLKALSELKEDDAVALCDELMHAAILRLASDIHIDPGPEGVQIRFRVDGVLEVYRQLPSAALGALISRFKVLSGLDIAEKRAPQDGGFKHRFGRNQQTVDIRTATLPTKFGERMTLRLLALQTEKLTLERLGMSTRDLACFEHCISRPHGMILLTGPTGSGKTTTLYAAIRRLIGRESLNVITVEDPIEYEIAGVAQVEVDAADKVTFSKALRSVLRHDPDVVMIGEVRDLETADVAIKASLTGHVVFSTLHTNSAASVLTRLAHMGVERYLIAATLRLAVAQRLVRRLCPRCRKPRPLAGTEAQALNQPDFAGRTVYEPGGCLYCADRGYLGRIALFELLPLDDDWARLVSRGAEEIELVEEMRRRQIPTLMDDAAQKLFAGETSLSEVLGAVAIW